MTKTKATITIAFTALLAAAAANAQTAAPTQATTTTQDAPRVLDAVVVSGRLPAPGLWELTRGDKTLLIMGTLSPTPRSMEWDPETVAAGLRRAQVVLGQPGISVSSDSGLLGTLFLLPAYKKSRRLPDDKTLRDVLSPALYARWKAAKDRYLPDDDDVETLRPVYAAQALFDAAVRSVGLTTEDRVDPAIYRLAKSNDVPYQGTRYHLRLKNGRATLKQLAQAPVDDGTCLVQTLDRLDSDVSMLVARANAWAEGDVTRLQAMPFHDQKPACMAAMANNAVARAEGLGDPEQFMRNRWLRIVRENLSSHSTVLAEAPMRYLEGGNSVLAAFRAEGYEIKAPE